MFVNCSTNGQPVTELMNIPDVTFFKSTQSSATTFAYGYHTELASFNFLIFARGRDCLTMLSRKLYSLVTTSTRKPTIVISGQLLGGMVKVIVNWPYG